MLKYCTSTSLSFIASRAAASARTLKPTMRACEAAASCTSEMVMPPTPLAMIFTCHFVGGELVQRIAQRLGAALHVGLEQDRDAAELLLFHLREHVAASSRPASRVSRRGTCPGDTARLRAPCVRSRPRGIRRPRWASPAGPAPAPASTAPRYLPACRSRRTWRARGRIRCPR